MAAVLSESVLDQNGPNDHFGQNRPKWTKMVHFGPLPQKECDKRSSMTFSVMGHFSVTVSDVCVTFFIYHFFARLLLPDSFSGRVSYCYKAQNDTKNNSETILLCN